jgi:N-acetylneuraminate synthase
MKDRDKVYIIAEAGVNHNGSLDMAIQLVEAAAKAGADAVKFQTFKTENVISRNAPKAEYQKASTGQDESQFDMVKKLELGLYEHEQLLSHCKSLNIDFLSTPFDLDSVDLLVKQLHVNTLKIPSGEITNAPLLLKAAQTGCYIILSTGMANLGEIEQALGVLAYGYSGGDNPSLTVFREAYDSQEGQEILKKYVTLLHCTTEYPAPLQDVNLYAMNTMRSSFGLSVGYSDHTQGIHVPVAAVALGATVIEKHFTLDRTLPGPDHQASLEPAELRHMIQTIREVEAALGTTIKRTTASESKNKAIARKSLVAARDIHRGEAFSIHNITAKRPGTGISPMYSWQMLGQIANRDYKTDEVIDS